MKKLLFLIILFVFISCNQTTPRDLTEKPELNELVGNWKMDLASYNAVMKFGFRCNEVRLTLNENGSFQVENFPNVINEASKKDYADCQSIEGLWSLEKRFSENKYAVLLKFDEYQTYGGNNLILFEVLMENKKLVLRHSFRDFRDLSSDDRMQFFKVEQ